MLLTLEMMAAFAKMKFYEFCIKEDGDVNVVSIVVLIGIALVLAVLFRGQIESLLNTLFGEINKSATKAIK